MSIKTSITIKKRKKRRHSKEVREDKTQNLKGLTKCSIMVLSKTKMPKNKIDLCQWNQKITCK